MLLVIAATAAVEPQAQIPGMQAPADQEPITPVPLPPAADPFHIRALFGAANRASGQAALAVHALRAGGGMHFTLSHTASVQDEEWARAVARSFRTRLETANPSTVASGPACAATEI